MNIIKTEEKEMNQFLAEHRDSEDESEDDDEKPKPLPSPSQAARKVVEPQPSPKIIQKEIIPSTPVAPAEPEKV